MERDEIQKDEVGSGESGLNEQPEEARDSQEILEESCCEDQDLLRDLQSQLTVMTQKKDEYLQMAQRTQADFENFRRRNRAAVADAYRDATCDTAGAFLPVLDNLERAVTSAREANSADALLQGIEMVLKQFQDVLVKLEVEEIEAMGKPFDPELHNAVMQVESDEEYEENTVVEVFQKGYRHKDKVIRYSMVKVAK